jgi:hypothetical protein
LEVMPSRREVHGTLTRKQERQRDTQWDPFRSTLLSLKRMW